jgi:hypothetical protein
LLGQCIIKEDLLWDDNFYYDVVEMSDGTNERLKVRPWLVIPMFAEIMNIDLFKELKEFQKRANEIIRTRPDLASLISNLENANKDGNFLFDYAWF